MGRFKHLVDSPAKIEAFKARYHIPQEVALRYCALDQLLTHREEGKSHHSYNSFYRMTLPMGRITRDYLINHRLCPHQCVPSLFRVLGSVDALNEHLGLGLTWHDVVHMYECHSLANARFYLKSRLPIVRLVSCLPKSNKGIKDNYMIASGAWHDGLYCPIREGELVGIP